MTAIDMDWTGHAQRLSEALLEAGDINSPQWHHAVAAVPRHLLVPAAYDQDNTGAWRQFDTEHALERVYSRETLVTAVADIGDGHQVPVSSSTKPDLMVRMLEILDIHDGHRVLEIGTGTGYNAALLAHRLGDDHVFSIDVGEGLVALARERLACAGFRPTLVAIDGVHGLPQYGPYDRIIATCSVPAVPWAWADQLADDGAVLVDVKLATSAGNLVHLRREGARLQGRFTTRWAAFMAMRHDDDPPPAARAQRAPGGQIRSTEAPVQPWNDAPVVWFLAQLRLPKGIAIGFDLDPNTRQPTDATMSLPDGSWARANLTDRTVTEAGPTRIWSAIEWAHQQWIAADRPTWDRLGLTVTHTEQRLWLDAADNGIGHLP
ncbi:methyltransferase domain-containing protein [Actinokineospora sp.]|uniref:methyltransferase domain-containing protein n=1 Tax=Actinokineospora sp. TaxID=1872133 RepID=UPI004037B1C7